MDNIFEDFTITVLKLNKLVQRIKNFEMKECGLKTIHVMCIYYLKRHSEGLTSGELTKMTLEDKGAISRALKCLREKGYVSYDCNKYNVPILLTKEGDKIADIIMAKADAAVAAGKDDFTDEERENFYSRLHAIANNLENYYNSLTDRR